MFKKNSLVLLLAISLGLAGCGPRHYAARTPSDDDLIEVSHDIVDELFENLKQPMPRGSLVVINSLVNVQNLSQSFPLGRIVSDQIASAFHHAGYRIVGMELPTEIFVKNDAGILALSDATKEALKNAGAQFLVVGSFAAGKAKGYISLRVIDLSNQHVISMTDYAIAMGGDAKILFNPEPQ